MMKKLIVSFIIFMLSLGIIHANSIVEDALLNKTGYILMGTFGQYDFPEKDQAFDWAFTMLSSGKSYQLQGNSPTANDVFGWKEVSIETPQPAWYMFQLDGDVDGDGSGKFDWVLVSANPNSKAAYKLAGVAANGTFEYSAKLNIDYYVSGTALSTGPAGFFTEDISALYPSFVIKKITTSTIDFEFDIAIGAPIKPRIHYYYTLNGKNDIAISDIKSYSPVWKSGDAAIRVSANTKVKVLAVLYGNDATKSLTDPETSVSHQSEKLMTTSMEDTSLSFTAAPANIKTDESNSWNVTIGGKKSPYAYTVSWGDSTSDNGVLNEPGDATFEHTYTKAGHYLVMLSITDSSGVVTSISSQTNVSAPLSITSVAGATELNANETTTWTLAYDGGTAPYKAVVTWGDSSAATTYTSHMKTMALSHSYAQNGTYMFKVTLSDANGLSQSKIQTVYVQKNAVTSSLGINSITGPTELLIDQSGTWSVDFSGGVAPFEALVNWQDGSAVQSYAVTSLSSVTVSHLYALYSTFTFNVTLIDNDGISDTKSHTVTVKEEEPGVAPSLTYTLHTTCTDAFGSSTGDYTGSITLNDDDTLSITGTDDQVFNTPLLSNNEFSYTSTVLIDADEGISVTDIFAGSITLNESSNVMTGSGTHTLTVSDDSLSCTGTWSSD